MKRAAPTFFVAAAVVLFTFGAASPSASAEPEYYESYGGQVEPICHANAESSLPPHSILEPLARLLARESRNLATTTDELAAVPVRTADEGSIVKWLKDLKVHAALLKQTSMALRLGREPQARRLVHRLDHNARLTNQAVADFHFRYCVLIAPRFREIKFNLKTLR
jgi:hypothetical protein